MPPLLKSFLPLIVTVVLVVIGFTIHPLLGFGVIIAFIALSVFMNRAVIYVARGNQAFAQGNERQALEWMEKAYQTNRAHPQHIAGYAYLLNRTGKAEQAAKMLQDLLARQLPEPVKLQASVSLATSYWLLGKKDEAYGLLEKFYPAFKSTQLYGTLGYYKLLRGDDLKKTLSFNLEAYDYNSDDMTITDNLAQTYYFLGELGKAHEFYEKVMEKRPKNADSYYYHALTLKGLGRLEEAREQIEQARHRKFALISPITQEDVERVAKELAEEDAGVEKNKGVRAGEGSGASSPATVLVTDGVGKGKVKGTDGDGAKDGDGGTSGSAGGTSGSAGGTDGAKAGGADGGFDAGGDAGGGDAGG